MESRKPHDSHRRHPLPCPDELILASLVDGRLAADEAAPIREHLAECETCVALVADLVRLQELETPAPPARLLRQAKAMAAPAPPASSWRWWTWAPAGAGALAALVLMLAVRAPEPPPIERSSVASRPLPMEMPALAPAPPPAKPAPPVAVEQPVYRVTPAVVEAPGLQVKSGRLSQGEEIRWAPVEHALYYEVFLLAEDGGIVWQGRTASSPIRLPAVFDPPVSGRHYLTVRAWMPDGRSIPSKTAAVELVSQH
jgi:hypothetical protein